jgi:hypothetical protein
MKKRKIKPYVGITLAFVSRCENVLEINRNSYLIRASILSDAIKAAKKIGRSRSWGDISSHDNFQKYIGITDMFYVKGPMKHGAMMGQDTLYSYKKVERIRKLLRKPKDYSINQEKNYPVVDDLYILEFLYFLGPPVPYKYRSAKFCWGMVKSPDRKNVLREGKKLANSQEFKEKIKLSYYDKVFSSDSLQFIGINDVIQVFEKLRVGNCFLCSVKRIDNIKKVKSISVPDPEIFNDLFKALRKQRCN